MFAHDSSELRQDEDDIEEKYTSVLHGGGSIGGGSDSTGGSPISLSQSQYMQQQTPQPTRILSRALASGSNNNNTENNAMGNHTSSKIVNGSNSSLASTGGAPPCHAFQRSGVCSRGANCPYSHIPRNGTAQQGEMSDSSSVVSGGFSSVPGNAAHMNEGGILGSKYKTALCHAFQKNNRCANGDNCR